MPLVNTSSAGTSSAGAPSTGVSSSSGTFSKSGASEGDASTGAYRCAACGAQLFREAARFDAGTGFPTFAAPASGARVCLVERTSHGKHRIQVTCAACDAHLGHRFADAEQVSGARYCIAHGVLLPPSGGPGSPGER